MVVANRQTHTQTQTTLHQQQQAASMHCMHVMQPNNNKQVAGSTRPHRISWHGNSEWRFSGFCVKCRSKCTDHSAKKLVNHIAAAAWAVSCFLQCFGWILDTSQKCSFGRGSKPPSNPTASQSVQPFLQGSQSWPTDTQTETGGPHYFVSRNRLHLWIPWGTRLPCGVICVILHSAVLIKYRLVRTDGPMDKQILLLLLLLLHPFNGLFSRTTWVSWYQKGKTSLDLNEAKEDGVVGWQSHKLDHMQTICTLSVCPHNTNTSSLNFYRPDALPDAQPTVSKHWKTNRHTTTAYTTWSELAR